MNLVQEFKNSSTMVKILVVTIVSLILASLACGCILLFWLLLGPGETAPAPAPPISFATATPGGETTPEAPTPITGWTGEYFSNPDLQGEPTLVRDDEQINFDWGEGAPAPDMPADNFSVRWTNTFEQVSAGPYRVGARFDNRVRIWVDDVMVIDNWRESPVRDLQVDVNLAAGTHSVKVEYGHLTGVAVAQVTAQAQEVFPNWKAEYFDNPDLAGSPVVVRNEVQINYNWGATSPIPGVVPDNNYSVRWTQNVDFQQGSYLVRVFVEGGVRIWFDGKVLIDSWGESAFREVSAPTGLIDRGKHSARVEFVKHTGNGQIAGSVVELQEPNEPPLAVINGPVSAQAGTEVPFTAQNSSVAEGSHLVTFSWDFGDGTTGDGVNAVHVYNNPAVYDVKLTVTDDKGLSDTSTHRIEITQAAPTPAPDQPPVAVIVAPSKAEVSDKITFDGRQSRCAEQCVRYDWDLGDGTKFNAVTVQHVYLAPAIYNVTLTVTDNKGLKGSTVKQIEIRPESPGPTPTPGPTNTPAPGSPVAVINANPTTAQVNQGILFDGAGSLDSNGNPCSNCNYAWDLGDNTTDNRISFSKAYASPGTYNVILVVTDLNTNVSSSPTSVPITINAEVVPTETPVPAETATPVPSDPPSAVIVSNLQDASNVAVGTTGVFNCTSSVPGAGATIGECTWTFSDDSSTQTGPEVSHIFSTAGSFSVDLTVKQTPGDATGSASLPVTVQ